MCHSRLTFNWQQLELQSLSQTLNRFYYCYTENLSIENLVIIG